MIPPLTSRHMVKLCKVMKLVVVLDLLYYKTEAS